ncbi:3-hydroxyisobutyrate dehydrogenase [Microbulbifer sp. NBRC 101763]|uniref:3-hydroxyisobutyrate dehydrogenase n=1 Tax=unclassified Microbulbifer TaxID=2619833 RepID=UPI0024ADCD6E|nr:3-hydroxyisobutyrate dehydrogenase [Microbulbifer sp. MLAF003]WHI51693.1 3-hydroxyisobutyrate dehydrogenase [Microbulbifer sp. MLAF003]
MATSVAFFGLGHMGAPMASNLVKAGFQVKGYDPVTELLDNAEKQGIEKCVSPHQAVVGVDFIVSMLPNDSAVESLYLDEEKLLEQITENTLVIDCSTISTKSSKRLLASAQDKKLHAIEAPVSGGVAGAAAGTLSFMCGGNHSDVERAREILQHMGANIFHAGPAGAGQTAKICNNMLLAIHMIGTAEALQLGVDNGLDPIVLSEIMSNSSGANWSLQKYNPYPGVMSDTPASKDYTGGFMVKLMCKDLGLAQQAANNSQSYTPLGSLARNLYGLHDLAGNHELDFSSIQRMFQKT